MSYKKKEPQFSLAFDCETSGYSFPNYAEKHQMISFGVAIVKNDTLEIVDKLYREIKFNSKFEWSIQAEAVHGLTIEHLEKNGSAMQDACVDLVNLVVKYWGIDSPVMIMGHNPQFDIHFIKSSLEPLGLMFPIYHRIIDSSVAGFVNLNKTLSDDIFDTLALPTRTIHNAMQDVEITVEALKTMRLIFQNSIN